MSFEHPDETFLKNVPKGAGSRLQVHYPADVPLRLVRRRLRLLVNKRMEMHRKNFVSVEPIVAACNCQCRCNVQPASCSCENKCMFPLSRC